MLQAVVKSSKFDKTQITFDHLELRNDSGVSYHCATETSTIAWLTNAKGAVGANDNEASFSVRQISPDRFEVAGASRPELYSLSGRSELVPIAQVGGGWLLDGSQLSSGSYVVRVGGESKMIQIAR